MSDIINKGPAIMQAPEKAAQENNATAATAIYKLWVTTGRALFGFVYGDTPSPESKAAHKRANEAMTAASKAGVPSAQKWVEEKDCGRSAEHKHEAPAPGER